MRIVVADRISEVGMQLLRMPGWEIVTPSKEEFPDAMRQADALIVRSATRVTQELLESGPRLRVVGRAGVGVDNIDLDCATRRGILVMNTPGGNSVSVAEHTMALLMSLARMVPQLNSSMHAGRWEKAGLAGTELRGKTLGLVGFGRVGNEVARRARAFEMRVVACDPYVSEAAAGDAGVDLASMADLLAQADFVSLHTALSAATEKVINAATLAQCKRGAMLINTARGELVDEAALVAALRSGQLAGAALDVFATEPPSGSPLLEMSNVITTPHVAGSTREAQEEVGILIAQQVRDFLADGAMRNAVNFPALSGEQYRRLGPYVETAGRLGAFLAQISGIRFDLARITLSGEPAELGASVLRSAALAGLLNVVLDEKVNLVNAGQVAASRGLSVEERTRRREWGYPNTIEMFLQAGNSAKGVSAEATVLHGTSPRILGVDGIELEAPLGGTMLFLRNRDVPGVIGEIGTILGSRNVNISTFALGRRAAECGADAIALVQLDGEVSDGILEPIRGIGAVVEARLVRLPAGSVAARS